MPAESPTGSPTCYWTVPQQPVGLHREPVGRHREPDVRPAARPTGGPTSGLLDRLRSRSLVFAGLCLAGLGVLAHQLGDEPTTHSGSGFATRPGPGTGPGPVITRRPSATASSDPGIPPRAFRQVVVVPRSVCHRFVETLGGTPTQALSVQNSCQWNP